MIVKKCLWSKVHAQHIARAAVLHCSYILCWRHCEGQGRFPMVFFLGLPFHWSLPWWWDHNCLVLSQLCQKMFQRTLLSPFLSRCCCRVHGSVWWSHSCARTLVWSSLSFLIQNLFPAPNFCSVRLHDKSYSMDGSFPCVHSTPC